MVLRKNENMKRRVLRFVKRKFLRNVDWVDVDVVLESVKDLIDSSLSFSENVNIVVDELKKLGLIKYDFLEKYREISEGIHDDKKEYDEFIKSLREVLNEKYSNYKDVFRVLKSGYKRNYFIGFSNDFLNNLLNRRNSSKTRKILMTLFEKGLIRKVRYRNRMCYFFDLGNHVNHYSEKTNWYVFIQKNMKSLKDVEKLFQIFVLNCDNPNHCKHFLAWFFDNVEKFLNSEK